MKVHQLIEQLQQLPQDFDVVMAYGPDTDDCALVFDTRTGWYDQHECEFTARIYEIDNPDERLYRARRLNECNAIILQA